MAYPFVRARHFHAGRRRGIRLAVVHTPEFPELDDAAERVAAFFSTTSRPASTHLVGDNNTIVRCVHDGDTAFGAENANADGLHYELAGYAGQSEGQWDDPYSNAALRVAAPAFRDWCELYALPKRRLSVDEIRAGRAGICGHADVYQALGGQAVRTDPGAAFPWAEFIALVNGGDVAAPKPKGSQMIYGVKRAVNAPRPAYYMSDGGQVLHPWHVLELVKNGAAFCDVLEVQVQRGRSGRDTESERVVAPFLAAPGQD